MYYYYPMTSQMPQYDYGFYNYPYSYRMNEQETKEKEGHKDNMDLIHESENEESPQLDLVPSDVQTESLPRTSEIINDSGKSVDEDMEVDSRDFTQLAINELQEIRKLLEEITNKGNISKA
ncbi:hypothetical protein [Desertibacillus haloalkaliphilus]|uniref:hypothetical protein n=1 Tax=Desertibacillus haloalkaliphilus TaxID=1328930 RepID=UPI001C25F65F|nr:hypothetical protein [Desertibacillus haloalkaliphilus]MBU8908130.1 hypothetical protein [Desertibacillus haloalkaliphilus]